MPPTEIPCLKRFCREALLEQWLTATFATSSCGRVSRPHLGEKTCWHASYGSTCPGCNNVIRTYGDIPQPIQSKPCTRTKMFTHPPAGRYGKSTRPFWRTAASDRTPELAYPLPHLESLLAAKVPEGIAKAAAVVATSSTPSQSSLLQMAGQMVVKRSRPNGS